jgi:hypothetical protein
MPQKVKINFVVPTSLQNDLRERVIKDGYGLRGKSKWISEAILELFQVTNFPELVDYNDEMSGFERTEAISVDHALKDRIMQGIKEVRKCYPTIEGVQSRIIRTAILQRLIRK